MTSKKGRFLSIILSGILMCSLLRADAPEPWYYNGWKAIAAAYGITAVGLSCASIIFFKEHKKITREDYTNSDLLSLEARTTKICAHGCLVCGISFALSSALLYHHSTCKK